MAKDKKDIYREIQKEDFPEDVEIRFGKGASQQILTFRKTVWNLEDGELGLRYGENPDQPAALYRLAEGRASFGGVEMTAGGLVLASQPELLQSGKHPSKINITDADAALTILRWLDEPACVIVKHNNPCGAALGASLCDAFTRAYLADRIAAFGGCVGVNRALDKVTAESVLEGYVEVVLAPEYEDGVLEKFRKKPNVRVLRIRDMERLREEAERRVLECKSLIDGGMILQWSFIPQARKPEDFLPAQTVYKGQEFRCLRHPNDAEWRDLVFGWIVESGVTSNSVLYVKNGVTVGIGTGEQDRVGVAEIARDKAYRKLADRLAWERHGKALAQLGDKDLVQELEARAAGERGGLRGAVMVSDAFFPFRDGIEVGLREGVTAVVQPGGSLRDFESIEACNEVGAAMVFTGQRCFRH